MAFLTDKELKKLGFRSYGNNVLISDKATFYSPETISIGSNVRIDDFCILSGKIELRNYIHISAYSVLYGKYGIKMEDFTGISPRCTVFSASDDFSGNYMISPMVFDDLTNVKGGKVVIKTFAQVGANSTIMPDVIIEEGCVIGAMSLVKNSTLPWKIYGGIPSKLIKNRNKDIISIHKKNVHRF